MELLAQRQRQQSNRGPSDQAMRSGIIVRVDGSRFIVSDSFSSFACESVIADPLRPGDRVWVGSGRGVSVILGLQGRDVDFI